MAYQYIRILESNPFSPRCSLKIATLAVSTVIRIVTLSTLQFISLDGFNLILYLYT